MSSLTRIPGNDIAKLKALNTEISDGKSVISTAITNKGITTSSIASFDTMATNISSLNISKYKTGTILVITPTLYSARHYYNWGTKYDGTSFYASDSLTIPIGFVPKVLFLTATYSKIKSSNFYFNLNGISTLTYAIMGYNQYATTNDLSTYSDMIGLYPISVSDENVIIKYITFDSAFSATVTWYALG